MTLTFQKKEKIFVSHEKLQELERQTNSNNRSIERQIVYDLIYIWHLKRYWGRVKSRGKRHVDQRIQSISETGGN